MAKTAAMWIAARTDVLCTDIKPRLQVTASAAKCGHHAVCELPGWCATAIADAGVGPQVSCHAVCPVQTKLPNLLAFPDRTAHMRRTRRLSRISNRLSCRDVSRFHLSSSTLKCEWMGARWRLCDRGRTMQPGKRFSRPPCCPN